MFLKRVINGRFCVQVLSKYSVDMGTLLLITDREKNLWRVNLRDYSLQSSMSLSLEPKLALKLVFLRCLFMRAGE